MLWLSAHTPVAGRTIVSNQTQPEWGAPTEPSAPQPPKPKRQFLVTKIAVGVAVGIALFLVGVIVLIAVLIGGGAGGKQATTAPTALPASAFPGRDTTSNQFTPDSAPADETPTTQPAEVGKTGDTFTATGDGSSVDITITKITTATVDRGTIEPNDSSFWDHPTNGLYLIVRMTVKGDSGSFDINPAEFVVISPDGQTYDDQTNSDTWGQPLPLTAVHQGQTRRGVIVFDVPTKHGQVAYNPNFDGDPIAIWSY